MWQAHNLVNTQSDHAHLLRSGGKSIPTCIRVRNTASHDTIVKFVQQCRIDDITQNLALSHESTA